MQFLLLSRAASTRRISELPCRLSGTKNHHFAKLRFHDFQRGTTSPRFRSPWLAAIVLDGAGYHRSDQVVNKAKELNIKLHYLPPYSPNLNPIERLWKVMNEQVRNNKYFATAKEFRNQINHFFDDILPEIAESLNGRINDNFQVLHSAS